MIFSIICFGAFYGLLFSQRPLWELSTGEDLCIWPEVKNCLNHLTPNGHFSGRTAPLTYRCCIFLFIQQIYVLNMLNMLHTLRFFFFKCRLFHNATFFGSCIIHILYTGVLKFKRKFRLQKVNHTMPRGWIGRGAPDTWPPRSPDFTTLNSFLLGDVKNFVRTICVPRTGPYTFNL
jgi:hypothetical protein